ncbi:MAG: hypothetical protein DDT33_01277 [Firmicutes bacterium]|nr:hypothetical protein [Bacillota bacterium]
MELEDPEGFIMKILLDAGYQKQGRLTAEEGWPDRPALLEDVARARGSVANENGEEHTDAREDVALTINTAGEWKRTLTDTEVTGLVELVSPLYQEGQRQDLILSLSGWMGRAEIDPKSALEVVKTLSQGDNEQDQRVRVLKDTYQGLGEKEIKGASGVYELLKREYQRQYPPIEKPKKDGVGANRKRDRAEAERVELIEKQTIEHYRRIKEIIVHPQSGVGVARYLKIIKEGGKNQMRAIKKVHQFLRVRYDIIRDSISNELAIYDPDKGYYKFYNDNEFQEFLIQTLGDDTFTIDEVKKVKGMFGRRKDQSEEYIVFENGLLNMVNMELSEFTPNHFLTFNVPYNWNPGASGGYVQQKLEEILIDEEGEDRGSRDKYQNYLETIGYMFLYGNPRQKLFLLVGPPNSGKTQLINLIAGIFRDSVSSVPLQAFSDRFGLQPLIGKRVNTLYDISEEEIRNPSVLKAVTGNDSMTIDVKYKDPITYTGGLPVKTIGGGNQLPKIRDNSGAVYRRLNIIQLANSFVVDPVENLSEKLLKNREGMEWLIYTSIEHYHCMVRKKRGFKLDHAPIKVEEEYLKMSDPCLYAMKQLYVFTNDENDFYTSTELIMSINSQLSSEGLKVPKDVKNNHHVAIRGFGGEYTRRRVNRDLKQGYTLIGAKLPGRDPKKIRLDKETMIRLEKGNIKEVFEELPGKEENIIMIMRGLGFYNLTDVIFEAEQKYGMSKTDVMKVLEKFKRTDVLRIDNSIYGAGV